MKELRKAIEDANSGQVNRTHMHPINPLQQINFFHISASFFQAAETPKPRDVESPKDTGVRRRKGGQANTNGQVTAFLVFMPLILD